MNTVNVEVLDGPVGTELLARGVPTPLPLWSAAAIASAPGVLGEGAEVHAVSAAKAASPITKARQGVEVTARPYDAGVARTKR